MFHINRDIPERSRLFPNIPECLGMFWNVVNPNALGIVLGIYKGQNLYVQKHTLHVKTGTYFTEGRWRAITTLIVPGLLSSLSGTHSIHLLLKHILIT